MQEDSRFKTPGSRRDMGGWGIQPGLLSPLVLKWMVASWLCPAE